MSRISRRFMMTAAVVVATVLVAAGCGRRVVLDPDEVRRHNTEWTLRRPAVAPATALPPADAGPPPAATAPHTI